MPIELFVCVGTFLEEVISPIPSIVILLPAGAAAHAQGLPFWYLGVLAFISCVARMAGALILYWLADKFEDVLFGKGRRIFGLSHRDVERFGKTLSSERGKVHVWLALFFMHALPIFPGALLSVGSGFIKIPLPLFISTAFLGSMVNAMFYLCVGYAGVQAAQLVEHLGPATQIMLCVFAVGVVLAAFYWYKKYRSAKKQKR